ncbi:hypothetical protein V6N12_069564 [Hibiscus sabdariffa]|uniref:Uncharacterized protein n=1 Tax=Hibiscus sabdariffa TaxID=183260 RepID=A0ABR2FEA4_9ROSI
MHNEIHGNPNSFSLENNSGRPPDIVISHEASIFLKRHACENGFNVSMMEVGNGSSTMVNEEGETLNWTPHSTINDLDVEVLEEDVLIFKYILRRIVAMPTPNSNSGYDSLSWRWEENQQFTTRSAYKALCPRVLENDQAYWRTIWALQEDEDVLHTLRGCPRARLVWLKLLHPSKLDEFMSLHLKDWMLANINTHVVAFIAL